MQLRGCSHMMQSLTGLSYRSLYVIWHNSSQEPPVPREDVTQRFQLLVIAKEELDIEVLLAENALAQNVYPTIDDGRISKN